MTSDPYADFADPVDSQPAPGGLVPSQRNMDQAEMEQLLRTPGMTPEALRRYYGDRERIPVNSDFDEIADIATEYYASGGQESPRTVPLTLTGPDGTPSTPAGAFLRSGADVVSFNFADEIGAFLETGETSGPAYEEAWRRRQQQRAADASQPEMSALGAGAGMLATAAIPAGPLSQITGMGRQMAAGAGVGAGMTALAGYGAAAPGEGAPTLAEDLALGGIVGGAAAPIASALRTGAQVIGARPETAAIDALQASRLDPAELRRLADEFYQREGRGARLIDIIPQRSATKLTGPLNRSEDAAERVIADLEAERASLAPRMTQRILDDPTGGQLPVPANAAGASASGSQRRAAGPDAIRSRTEARGDAEFPAFYEAKVEITPQDRFYLQQNILDGVTFDRRFSEELAESLETGQFTGKQLDLVRRKIAKRMRSGDVDVRETAKERMSDLLDLMDTYVPQARQPIANYRAGMMLSEGSEFGLSAAKRSDPIQTKEAMARLRPEQIEGVPLGARVALVEEAIQAPSASYAFAKKLEESPGYQAQVRQLLGAEGEANDLIDFALQQKKSIDNLAAAARIPTEKVGDLLDNTDAMADTIVAAGFGAGGAFKAALIRRFLGSVTPIGEKAANSLADMLLDPAKRDTAIKQMERLAGSKLGAREMVQSAFISAGSALGGAPSDDALAVEPPQ